MLGRHPHGRGRFSDDLLGAGSQGRLRPQAAVAGQLSYGVAYRTAARARVQAAERRSRDRCGRCFLVPAGCSGRVEPGRGVRGSARRMVRLPDKYRRPLVLCYLEGKTHEQAAREMAWPKRTVSDRLKRGCELLRQRLSRRGIALSAGALALLLADQSARAVPALLLLATVRLAAQTLAGRATMATAAGMASGVLKAVFATRTGVLLSLLLTFGLAVAGVGVLASQPEKPKPAASRPAHRATESRTHRGGSARRIRRPAARRRPRPARHRSLTSRPNASGRIQRQREIASIHGL